jgi:hypothetical protein
VLAGRQEGNTVCDNKISNRGNSEGQVTVSAISSNGIGIPTEFSGQQ